MAAEIDAQALWQQKPRKADLSNGTFLFCHSITIKLMSVILIWCVNSVGHDDIGSLVLVSKGACPALLSGSTCFLEGLQDLVSVARVVDLHVLSEPAGRKKKK